MLKTFVGFVLYFLVRLEPFCSNYLKLQGGYFDHPERMFSSIQAAWEGCLNGPSDVKELVSGFIYFLFF